MSRRLPGSTPWCPVWCLCASLRAGSGAGLPASGFSTEGSGCLKTKRAPSRKIARSIHEAACEKARAIARTETYAVSRRERKRVEMLFAHLKRILKLDQFRLRGPSEAKERFYWPPPKICGKLAKLIPLPAPVFATGGGAAQICLADSRRYTHRRPPKQRAFSTKSPVTGPSEAGACLRRRASDRPDTIQRLHCPRKVRP